MTASKLQFIRSLGYLDPNPDEHVYSALMLQPRLVGGVTVIGIVLQSPWVFLALSAALAWSAIVPTWSIFDGIYDRAVAHPRGLAPVAAAPAPRRFAGGMAATITLTIGLALLAGARGAAWALEGLAVVSVAAVVFGRSCAPAHLYAFLRRRATSRRPLGGAIIRRD
jgi:hypothetical protein